jgi:hypothetical protein
MADNFVQAPPDAGGKKVDAEETVNASGVTVERLRVSVPGGIRVSSEILDLLIHEVRMTNRLLAEGFRLSEMLRHRDSEKEIF